METIRNHQPKNNHALKKAPLSKDDIKRPNYQTQKYNLANFKQSTYLSHKVNTETSHNQIFKPRSNPRKLYCFSKGNIQRVNALNRKSYSKEIENKILNEKSFDHSNRFTINDFTFNDFKNESISTKFLKKNSGKPHSKCTQKKYRSPIQRKQDQYILAKQPVEIKCVSNLQRRVSTEPQQMNQSNVEILQQVGQGTFGKVYKAKYLPTGQIVAIKKVYQDPKYKSRELQIIQMLKSDFTMTTLSSYITYEGYGYQKQEYLNIIMEFYQCNFFEYIGRNQNLLNTLRLKILLYQMFRGLLYIHSLGICHRDIKPHNMLIRQGRLSLCDFGSAKILKKNEVNLSYICSRCYRAPELIFGSDKYTTQIDVWSVGCIILEILNKVPLFIGQNSLDHLVEVIKIMGTPTKSQVLGMNPDYDLSEYDFPHIQKKQWSKLFPGTDSLLLDLVNKIMRFSPHLRITACQALSHQYFDEIRDRNAQESIKQLVSTRGFFDFNEQQLKTINSKESLIPKWYSSS